MHNNSGETVHGFLEKSTEACPEKTAAVCGGQRISYRELNELANSYAWFLIRNGAVPGCRIAFFLQNSFRYMAVYYGIMKAGCIAVALNAGEPAERLSAVITDLQARVLFTSVSFSAMLPQLLLPESGINTVVTDDEALHIEGADVIKYRELESTMPAVNPLRDCEPDSVCSFLYTSGSTGGPRGVMLTHQAVSANTRSIISALNITPDDVQMVVLPFYYAMGKSLLNTHIAAGARIVINNSFAYPAAVLKEMVEEGVTAFSGVPSTYAYLLNRSPLRSYRDRLPGLRYCSQAGGHMPVNVKKALREALPEHTDIYIMYGATEASARLTVMPPRYFNEKIESIGIPIDGVEVKVVGDDGRECPAGKQGMLAARGANIMKGYWNDPELTASVLKGGWYFTGDIGYEDGDGFLYVTGRSDDLIKCGGHRVNLKDVEAAAYATGLVVEAAAAAVNDDLMGKRILLFASPVEPETGSEQLKRALSPMLPAYSMPAVIYIAATLPKTGSGKLDKKACLYKFAVEQDCIHP